MYVFGGKNNSVRDIRVGTFMILFNFIGDLVNLQGCLGELQDDLGFRQSKEGICVYISKAEETGLCISAKNDGYAVSYNSITDFCRGLCLLIDSINKAETTVFIKEERAFDCCGIMLDVSRNAVIKVATAKDFIKRIARMGLNSFMLYMENIYKIEEYPYFGYMRGAYSEEELKEIVAYQDVLQGLMDKQYEHVDLKGHYKKIIDKQAALIVPEDLQELFAYHAQLLKVLYLKCDIGIRITKDYRQRNLQALRNESQELLHLKDEVADMHKKMSVLWLKDNKAFGLDRIDLRFGGLMLRIQRAAERLTSYLNGDIHTIEELDEERLTFSDDEFVHCPFYNYYVSASMQIERLW